MDPPSGLNFNDLPPEVFLEISSKLEDSELLALSQTTHGHHDLVNTWYKDYVLVTMRRSLQPILLIERRHPKFNKIVNWLDNNYHKYEYRRFLTPYNKSYLAEFNYFTARRSLPGDPRSWSGDEYEKYNESIKFKNGKEKNICNNKESCVDFVVGQVEKNVLDILELHSIPLFNQTTDCDDNPKTRQEVIDLVKTELKSKNSTHWQIDNSHYNAEIAKINTNSDVRLYVKGHWNELQGKTVKPKFKKAEIYKIHDNGGRPFLVVYKKKKKKVIIYKHMNIHYNSENFDEVYGKKESYNIKIAQYKVKRCLPGEDTESEYDGNSVLLDLGKGKYVFIGQDIYEFNTPDDDKIIEFYSMIGNNDVPYPVCVGKKYAYFMLDAVYVPISKFPEDTDWMDGYSYFYGHVGNGKQMKGKRIPKYKQIHMRDW